MMKKDMKNIVAINTLVYSIMAIYLKIEVI